MSKKPSHTPLTPTKKLILTGYLSSALTVFVITCVLTLLFWSVARWLTVWFKLGQPNLPKPGGAA